MIIDILGRQIEIDDAKVMKVFEDKFKKYERLDMDKDEFIQRGLDYFEFNLEYNILIALNANLGSALYVLQNINNYKYFEQVSPFNKPFCETDPDMAPSMGLSKHDMKFLHKLGLSESRDEEAIKQAYDKINKYSMNKYR